MSGFGAVSPAKRRPGVELSASRLLRGVRLASLNKLPRGKRYKLQQVVNLLRQIEVAVANCKSTLYAARYVKVGLEWRRVSWLRISEHEQVWGTRPYHSRPGLIRAL
jgi:hypothetical protein